MSFTKYIEIRFYIAGLIAFWFLLFMVPNRSNAQETRVLVENAKHSIAENPAVLIKFYSKYLLYDEGVNIYRKQESTLSWIKINRSPVIKKDNLPAALLISDPDLEVFEEIIKSSSRQELQQDIIVFNVLVKSFQSNGFADYMGIYFEDTTALPGASYQYKINKIQNGRELLVGISSVIAAGVYQPDRPVENIEVFQERKSVKINWKPDEDRYYAVNVYRRSSKDTVVIKLNKNPLMISQITDSLGNLTYPDPMFSESIDLVEGITYTYQLAGLGFFENETEWSEPIEIAMEDVTPPAAPKNLIGKADSMKVHLYWENMDVPDLEGMNVYRSSKSNGHYEIVNSSILSIDHPEYHDTLLIPGPYYYFIAATDYSGNEAHSRLIFVEVQDVIPPSQPREVTIEADTGKITLSWKMGNEPDLAGYYLYRTVDKNLEKNYVLLNAQPLLENHFTQQLPKNVKNEFFYFVVAVDTSYNRSEPSEFVSGAMPDILAPEKPFIKDVYYEGEYIIVEWMPNVDSDLAGYNIYRSDSSRNFIQVNVNLLGGGTYRYTDRSNNPNTDYFYYLTAVDSVGNVSLPSKEVYARRVVKKDLMAGGISLRVKYNKRKKYNRLTWETKYPMDTRGYVVYRGELENRLRPLTGLISSTNYIDKVHNKNDVEAFYYQIRAYVDTDIIYSSKIKWRQKPSKQ